MSSLTPAGRCWSSASVAVGRGGGSTSGDGDARAAVLMLQLSMLTASTAASRKRGENVQWERGGPGMDFSCGAQGRRDVGGMARRSHENAMKLRGNWKNNFRTMAWDELLALLDGPGCAAAARRTSIARENIRCLRTAGSLHRSG